MATTRTHSLTLVNGRVVELPAVDGRSLLRVLREDLGLIGAKPGCGEGACGACTVLVDGVPVRSCVTPAEEAAGHEIATVEGLADGEQLHPLQRAFVDEGAVQCGYCTAGMLVAAAALLREHPRATPRDIREALGGHVCRCCSYPRIERAILRVAGSAEGAPPPSASVPADARFWEFRPAAPWDLVAPAEREYFELVGDGLVVVLEGTGGAQPFRDGGAWLHVSPGGRVTAFTGKVEMGQDNRTALSMIVADELGVDPARVGLAMGDTDLCPYDMGTFGSRSLPGAGRALERCAAAARRLLEQGAPEPGVRWLELAGDAPSTSPAGWRARGRPAQRATAAVIVRGEQRFPSDVSLPGMLHGWALRPPAHGSRLTGLEMDAARAVTGAIVVREDGFVGAAAADVRDAERAIHALRATWAPAAGPAERDLESYLRSHPIEAAGWESAQTQEDGDVDGELAAAEVRLESTYTTAYVAHASLETRVAVARWDGDRLTVWTGAQQPFAVRAALASALALDERDVRVIVPDIGGGFGSKHTEQEAIAAARLARAAGAPVRVALDRAEEFRHTYLRPAAVIDVRSGARDGRVTAWDFRNLNSGTAALDAPYRFATRRIAYQPADSPLPQGPYRALAATANTFARESHVDELAAAMGIDPVELRLGHLADEQLMIVLRAAAERAEWPGPAGDGRATGIACGIEKGGRVATAVDVLVEGDRLHVLRVISAFACGAIVNPDNLCRQIEGATVMGLGGALFEAIRFDAGRILNGCLREYRVPRFADVPPIETVLLDRPDLPPAGGGETPITTIAPALANAVFRACGRRLRSLPLLDTGSLRLA